MIPKEEREKDKAVLAADRLKGTWTNSDGKRKPGKSVFIAETAHEEKDVDGSGRPSRYGPTRDYVCNAFTVERAAAIALAHNRLPLYIAELNAIEEAVASYIEDVRGEVAEKRNPGAGEGHLDYQHGQIAALNVVLGMLRKPTKKRKAKRGGK